MTTFTQTLAWCTSYAELAHSAHSCTPGHVVSHFIGSSPESCHKHLHSHPWAHLLDSPLPFYFHLFFLVFSFYLQHSELYPELDNLIVMESLCYSANKGSDDAYDVSTSLTRSSKCGVSTSSLVFTLLCFLSRLLLYASFQFSLL